MIRIGVIGYGYWGPNLVRNFMTAPGSAVTRVCDLRKERLSTLGKLYQGLETCSDSADLINDPQIDAVVIATPVSTHFELAMSALKAGKHVLVEKPLAARSDQARKLVDEAAARNLVLLVDHTFVYTDAVRKIRELIASGQSLEDQHLQGPGRNFVALRSHYIDSLCCERSRWQAAFFSHVKTKIFRVDSS